MTRFMRLPWGNGRLLFNLTAVLCYNAHMQQLNFLSQTTLILDNLLHRKQEPEDEIVAAASALWQRMIGDVKTEDSTSDWVTELYAL